MSLELTVDIEDDRLGAEPHVGLALFADLSDLGEKLYNDFGAQYLQALVGLLRQDIVILITDQVNKDGHATQLDHLALVEVVESDQGRQAEAGCLLGVI